jgi:tetratricopeptide (TPR) repeat protein
VLGCAGDSDLNFVSDSFPLHIHASQNGADFDDILLIIRGLQFYRQGHAGAAIVSFTEAIEVDPKYADAYHHRGSVHFVRGEYDAAVADFTKAIETDYRSTAEHYLARGAVQIERRDYDAAIADFNEIIKLDAYNADAYYYRGLAHYRKGNLDAAIADYDRALRIVARSISSESESKARLEGKLSGGAKQ